MKASRLWSFARPYRRTVAVAGMAAALEAGVTLLIPWMAMYFTDSILAEAGIPMGVLVLLAGLFGVQMLLRFLNSWLSGRLALRVGMDMRVHIFDHLQSLPLRAVQQNSQGDLLALLTRETEALSQFLGLGLLGLPMACVTSAGAIVLMWVLDPLFTLLLLLILPLAAVILKTAAPGMRDHAANMQKEYARLMELLGESLATLPLIKAYVREHWASSRHRQQSLRLQVASERQLLAMSALQPLLQFLATLGVLGLFAAAAGRLVASSMTPGELIGFILYAVLLMRPVGTFGLFYSQLQTARGALRRLHTVLDIEGEETKGDSLPTSCLGELQFEALAFSYNEHSKVIDDFNLHIRPGEVVAITGVNGAGKSTLLSLLLRFLEPDRGRILLDGEDISLLDVHWLRNNIALVSQQTALLDASVSDNLAFGNAEATQNEMEAVARVVGLHELIESLPLKYATRIGEQGSRLSGGQRQRLALARALLKPAPILVLDEATAMLDPEGEKRIIAGCRSWLAGRTVILITHHLASLELADRVLELRSGQIHDTGRREIYDARQADCF